MQPPVSTIVFPTVLATLRARRPGLLRLFSLRQTLLISLILLIGLILR